MELADYYNWFIQRLQKYKYNVNTSKYNLSWFSVFRSLSQQQKIWWHLKTFGKVTTMDVELIYFFPHPPGIIRDIRDKLKQERMDYAIGNVEKNGYTVWGKPCKYYEYTLEEL